MLNRQFERNIALIGEEGQGLLSRSRVAVFGLGGVGGHAAETLARCGIGALDLIDKDVVEITNLNRQTIALHSTLGQPKAEVMKRRVLDINPNCRVTARSIFFLPETADDFDFTAYDYIVDAVDNVTAKITLCEKAAAAGTPIISSMGMGNKLDPEQLHLADIYETSVCRLARVMRRELKKRGVSALKVVYSTEETVPRFDAEGSPVVSSMAFVPAAAGILLASAVVHDLTASINNI
ncbi:MAG: tRNA threonylcarbamoyladenosine dehydratase [Clostridia bacterium]|nr:tRNA threonylcarbamoyladenosine dehydratase [Clostridia bacterium]